MANRNAHLKNPQVFIAQFLELAWKGCRNGVENNQARDDIYHAMGGFPLAFEMVFGREPERREVDLVRLGAEERVHAWLLERGSDEMGFKYPKWWPGSVEMHKLRYRLGLPGGVKNVKEYTALIADVRAFHGKLCRARAEVLGRPLEMGDLPALEDAAAREYYKAA
jgi:hypothetical protein